MAAEETKPNAGVDAPAGRVRRDKRPRGLARHFLSWWTWQMAWRDSRTSRKKLLFFSCSIVLGIAALTAVGSLGRNLERAIEEQAKSLLGADLVIGSRRPLAAAEGQLFGQHGGEGGNETPVYS